MGEKILYSGDQEELLKQVGNFVTLIDDTSHIKRAASSAISRKMIEDNRPDKDHFLMHLIAMGAGEKFGFNKNGDDFPEAALKNDTGNYGHHTFVKFGHYFLEHRNKDPKKARGIIKASCYNTPMSRVELLVWGHKKKAEEDYELAKQGKELSFSMSCRVPFDVCSCCEKQAKTSRDYCDHAKYHMTQWMPAFKKFAYVKNPFPCFFDISKVGNRADRIAAHLEYLFSEDELAKAASAGTFIFSDQQAERAGIVLIDPRTGCTSPVRQAWLTKLAAIESYLNQVADNSDLVARDEKFWFAKQAAVMAFEDGPWTESQLNALRSVEPDCLFRHLAKSAAVLPFPLFYAYATNQSVKEAAEDPACRYAQEALLPTLFQDLEQAPAFAEMEEMWSPASEFKAAYYSMDMDVKSAVEEVTSKCSFNPNLVRHRALVKAAAGLPQMLELEKSATTVSDEVKSQAKKFATAYGFYKIAFVEAAAELHADIDDPTLLLITSQHNKAYVTRL